MTQVVGNTYLESLLQTWSQSSSDTLPWLNQLRADALERVNTLKIPTLRDEEWRFTDIAPLTKLPFPAAQTASQLQLTDVEHFFLPEATTRLVFVDGRYAPQLSCVSDESGIVAGDWSTLKAAHADEVEQHLGQHVDLSDNVFVALNTAFLQDSALVIVPRHTSVTAPIHILFIASQREVSSYPRCLIIAKPDSKVTIVEDYVALQETVYLTNAVTEISLADHAQVNHIRVQRDSSQAFHVANCSATLAHASRYQSVNVALGARISRVNLNVALAAEGAECITDGLALITGQQLADTHTLIDHIKPNGTSRQQHKCIVDGSAHAVFNGKIMVRQYAQHTDSTQSSRNLLLTSKAQVDTKPQLEIFADDVKCAHGATVGQLDKEEIFYLRSRGLSEIAARNLLTYAFGAEIIDRITVASLKQQLEQTILKHTQQPAEQ
jgi:Fe-S cluster assembly protein SufD